MIANAAIAQIHGTTSLDRPGSLAASGSMIGIGRCDGRDGREDLLGRVGFQSGIRIGRRVLGFVFESAFVE